jgi:hypothetical protein
LQEIENRFERQRDAMLDPRQDAEAWYQKAKEAISDRVGAPFQPLNTSREGARTILTMPPPLELMKHYDHSSHLVGLLPSERLDVKVDGVEWIVRVRASFTACALEITDGWPKIWWTFEGIPKDQNPDNRPSEQSAAKFLCLMQSLQQPALDYLTNAYAAALTEVTGLGDHIRFALSPERLSIRFADNNSVEYGALVDALTFRGLNPKDLRKAPENIFKVAKAGLADFAGFVNNSNPSKGRINPETAHIETEVKIPGVDAVTARHECPKSGSTWIAGVAHRANARTVYDGLKIVREQLFAENAANRIRSLSPARQLTSDLAGIEALKLEDRLRDVRQRKDKTGRSAPRQLRVA